jgi:hypothetical protein
MGRLVSPQRGSGQIAGRTPPPAAEGASTHGCVSHPAKHDGGAQALAPDPGTAVAHPPPTLGMGQVCQG